MRINVCFSAACTEPFFPRGAVLDVRQQSDLLGEEASRGGCCFYLTARLPFPRHFALLTLQPSRWFRGNSSIIVFWWLTKIQIYVGVVKRELKMEWKGFYDSERGNEAILMATETSERGNLHRQMKTILFCFSFWSTEPSISNRWGGRASAEQKQLRRLAVIRKLINFYNNYE